MEVAVQTLPCTPLEVPMAQEAAVPYLEYWRQQESANRRLKDAENFRRLAVAGSVLVRDPICLTSLPKNPVATMSSPRAVIIEAWDRALGSFNHMVDGQGDLLRGAAMILHDNHVDEDFPIVCAEPRDVAEGFLDIVDRLDIERQRPSHALLIGAQLVHKAAWIEEKDDRQSDLFTVAAAMYNRIHKDGNVEWGDDKLMAAEYAASIKFHDLSQRIRKSSPDLGGRDLYRAEIKQLLTSQLLNLLHVQDLIDRSPCARAAQDWTGRMLDLFVVVGLRDAIYAHSNLSPTHPEARAAFASEDEPLYPKSMKKKPSFDVVVEQVAPTGQIIKASMLQMKLGKSQEDRPCEYHPAIDVVTVKNIGGDRMGSAALAMLSQYNTRRTRHNTRALQEVMVALRPHVGQIIAA